ncbi:MAG: SDR family oxidoreductase [Chloroflexi bacterium]|nr:SDR family oxidoreductase [Chloroflexota bacterium]
MSDKIFITGGTGAVGTYLVEELIRRGADVRAGLRNPDKIPAGIKGQVEVVSFDFALPQTFEAAFAGVTSFFLLTPPPSTHPQELNLCAPAIDAAARLGVRHIVRLSSMWAIHAPDSSHRLVEKYIEATGMPYTHLRPNIFMQNFNLSQRAGIQQRNGIFVSAGDGKVTFVDIRDVAAAAAVVLTSEGHAERAYTLTGPQSLGYQEVAAVLSQALGRAITYHSLSDATLRANLQGAGWQPNLIDYVSHLYAAVQEGHRAYTAPDLALLLQREPITFDRYVRDHVDQWQT